MSKELEARVARLERAIGAAGYELREFDDDDQAKARMQQEKDGAEAEQKLAEKRVQEILQAEENANAARDRQLAVEEAQRADQAAAVKPPRTTKKRRGTTKRRVTTSKTRKRATDQPAMKQQTATGKLVSGPEVETRRGIRDTASPRNRIGSDS